MSTSLWMDMLCDLGVQQYFLWSTMNRFYFTLMISWERCRVPSLWCATWLKPAQSPLLYHWCCLQPWDPSHLESWYLVEPSWHLVIHAKSLVGISSPACHKIHVQHYLWWNDCYKNNSIALIHFIIALSFSLWHLLSFTLLSTFQNNDLQLKPECAS